MKIRYTTIRFSLSIMFLVNLYSCKSDIAKNERLKVQKIHAVEEVKTSKTIDHMNGVIFFSLDNGITWENKSEGCQLQSDWDLAPSLFPTINSVFPQKIKVFIFLIFRRTSGSIFPLTSKFLITIPGR